MAMGNDLFDYPKIAKKWREDFRQYIDENGANEHLVMELEEQYDEWMMPSLRRAHFIGLITDAQFVELGQLIHNEWAEFANEARMYPLIHHAFWGYP